MTALGVRARNWPPHEEPRVVLDPPLELRRGHEDQLAAEHDADERLHASLERVDAHAERAGGLLPGERIALHGLDRTAQGGHAPQAAEPPARATASAGHGLGACI